MSSNKKYNKKDIGIIAILILFVLASSVYNWSSKSFFKMDLYKIISLTLIVGVSYYLTQKKLDNRKKRDVLNEIINVIINTTYQLNKNTIQSENAKLFVMEIRNIENKISLIEKVSKEYKVTDEINYIKREVETINDMISNHISDKDTLLKIFVDIEKHIKNIQNKCEEMQFKIYFN